MSWDNTAFLMACLTPEGVAAFFPHTGEMTAGKLVEVGALIGDGLPAALAADIGSAPDVGAMAGCLDGWLLRRLAEVPLPREIAALAAARRLITEGHSVEAAATVVGTNRRQLARWHHRHLGVGPARLAQVARLQRSVRAIQDSADGMDGYADQAHQIRSWRKAFDKTPGAYRRHGGSALAAGFEQGASGLSLYV